VAQLQIFKGGQQFSREGTLHRVNNSEYPSFCNKPAAQILNILWTFKQVWVPDLCRILCVGSD